MTTFTIKNVGSPREWESEKWKKRYFAYPCDFEGPDGKVLIGVEWSRLQDSKPPEVGDKVVGEISGGEHGDRFKMDFEATKELGSGGRSGGSRGSTRDWTPDSARDPEKVARMGRSAAQKAAVALVTAMPGFGPADDSKWREVLRRWIDFFDLDIDEAGAAAKAAMGAGVAPPVGTVTPAGPTGSASSAPAQEQETGEQLHSLLEASGVNPAATRIITNYVMAEMLPPEQDAAISCLQDPKLAIDAVKRLRERTEQFHGEPLPSAEADDEGVPF